MATYAAHEFGSTAPSLTYAEKNVRDTLKRFVVNENGEPLPAEELDAMFSNRFGVLWKIYAQVQERIGVFAGANRPRGRRRTHPVRMRSGRRCENARTAGAARRSSFPSAGGPHFLRPPETYRPTPVAPVAPPKDSKALRKCFAISRSLFAVFDSRKACTHKYIPLTQITNFGRSSANSTRLISRHEG